MSLASTAKRTRLWILLGIALLVAAILPQVLIPRPLIGLLRIRYDIWTGSMELFEEEIAVARADPRIKAVVVQLDCPGGEVVGSQTLYFELLRLRREMPVVGSIDNLAASGGYYAALATEPLYAKPSSWVGNVGVWAYAPPELGVDDMIIASGPFKTVGFSRDEFLRQLDSVKQEFLATVYSARGARLTLKPEELSQGLIYLGREAVELGLVDRVGTQSDAIAEAARQAGIRHYRVVDLEFRAIERLLAQYEALEGHWVGAADPVTGVRMLPPGLYLLYDTVPGGGSIPTRRPKGGEQ